LQSLIVPPILDRQFDSGSLDRLKIPVLPVTKGRSMRTAIAAFGQSGNSTGISE
jgi:hypothetical protein